MHSSFRAGRRADLRLSCRFPNRWRALGKHSQIHTNAVNGKVPRQKRFELTRALNSSKKFPDPPRWQ
jgi:hypothetical protein